jgi:hypothetical protein
MTSSRGIETIAPSPKRSSEGGAPVDESDRHTACNAYCSASLRVPITAAARTIGLTFQALTLSSHVFWPGQRE